MSISTVSRTATTATSTPIEVPTGKEPSRSTETQIEAPYTDYEQETGYPYLVEYFQLGDTWNDPQGGFPNEIASLQEYVKSRIDSGEIANSKNAVREMLRGMEKLNNLSKEERAVVKIEILNNYVDFMSKNDEVKKNLRRYSNA